MIILVYSTESDRTIGERLGLADYSYFFVMKLFLPVLERLGQVEIIDDLAHVNPRIEQLQQSPKRRSSREDVVLLSFAPPQRTPIGLACPTLPVFAWEYSTIPDESWSHDTRQNWAAILQSLPGAITHSQFALSAVRSCLGSGYPIASLPAPLWDEYARLFTDPWRVARHPAWRLDLPKGVILDSHALGLAEAPAAAAPSFSARPCSVTLGGVVYTAVFNPNDGRKNWHDLLSAFCFAFRDQADATLLLKLAYHDAEHACGLIWHEMQKLAPYRCRIVAVHGFLDDGTYRHLIAHSTYVVNSAYGEGQCLPLMEFMSAGKPAIAPNHTAMADYLNTENAFIVSSSEEWTHWPHDPRLVLRAFRYRINWQSLHDAYRDSWRILDDDPARYPRMAQAAHAAQRLHCSQEAMTERLDAFLRCLGHRPARWPRLRQLLQRARARGLSALRKTPLATLSRRLRPSAVATPPEPAAAMTMPPPATVATLPLAPPATDSRLCGLADAVMSGWYLNDSGELLRGFALNASATVLDFGCGEGGASLFAARQGSEIIFADVDAAKVAALEQRMPGAGARAWRGIVCGDLCAGERLPLADGSITHVIAMEVLEHVPDPARLLAELMRVAAPGAQFLLSVPDPASERLQQSVAPAAHFQPPNHIHIFSREAFERLVIDAGLQIEHTHYSGFYWTLWMCLYWASLPTANPPEGSATRDLIEPPYPPLPELWARLWHNLIDRPEGAALKEALDEQLPKSQAIIARKAL